MRLSILALFLLHILTLFMMFAGFNHRVKQEVRICEQIPGADCSFLWPASR